MLRSRIRTALQVLRDEAKLPGLYPDPKNGCGSPHEAHHVLSSVTSPLTRRQRLAGLLKAEAQQDAAELRLVKHVTPIRFFHLPDTQLPLMMLNLLALMHRNEQMELALTYLHAVYATAMEAWGCEEKSANAEDDDDMSWPMIGEMCGYRYREGQKGWQLFAQEFDIDGDRLIKGNYRGCMLEVADEVISSVTTTAEDVQAIARAMGRPLKSLVTAEEICRSWRTLLSEVL